MAKEKGATKVKKPSTGVKKAKKYVAEPGFDDGINLGPRRKIPTGPMEPDEEGTTAKKVKIPASKRPKPKGFGK